MIGDIYSVEKTYDFVMASHVIEHVPEPLRFVRQLQKLSTKGTFVVAPYKERADLLSPGHLNIFNEDILNALSATKIHIVKSRGWGAFLNPPYEMYIAELPPKASCQAIP